MRNRVAIIGPGRMGLGIALAFALKGFEVTLLDGKERTTEAYGRVQKSAREEIQANLRLLKRIRHLQTPLKGILSRISFSHEIKRESLDAPFVFEAIPEKPDLKIKLFKNISRLMGPDSILASATSTIDLKTLKKGYSYPEKLLITHWLNPAFIIPLVEIAVSDGTDPRSVERMKKVLRRIGKGPVVLKDSPGFIVPRIQALAMNEAIRILEEGVAQPEDIDIAIKTGFAFRLGVMGLLEFVDLGGLDILSYADDFLYGSLKSERFKKPKFVEEKMKRGEIGPRGGKGIYNYKNVDVRALFERRYKDLIQMLGFMRSSKLL